MTIKDIQTHTQDAVSRLPDQFVNSSNLISLVSLNADRIQGLNDEAIKMLDGMSLSTASGKQLDGTATILNLTRIIGESDADFRARILSETSVLAKSGEPGHVIDVYLLLTEASSIFFSENYPAGIELAAHKDEAHNFLLWSEEFDNALWVKGTGVTVSPEAATAPDGSETADVMAYDGSHAANFFRLYQEFIGFDAGNYNNSIWLRSDTPITLRIVSGSPTTLIDVNVTETWQRFDADTSYTTGFFSFALYSALGDNSPFTVEVWGAQNSKVSHVLDYIKTTDQQILIDTSGDEAVINSMANVKAGGIDMILLISPETDFFFFDSEANVDASGNGTIDASGGFGSSLDVDGGQLSRVLT